MAAAPSPQKSQNSISGKVIVKESGLGIPDLVVLIYDFDPGTRPEEELPASIEVGRTVSNLLSSYIQGDSIGSVLTNELGQWGIRYDDSDFRVRNATEKRPDLFLMVLAPENSDDREAPMVLFQAKLLRQGRNESHCIRIEQDLLKKASIKLPNEEKQSAQSSIEGYERKKIQRALVNEGIARFNKSKADERTEEKKVFRKDFRRNFAFDPDQFKGKGILIKEGDVIKDKVGEVAETGITTINNIMDDPGSPGVPVNLYLSEQERTDLFGTASNGTVNIPASVIRPFLYRSSNTEDIGTLLISTNPLAKYCQSKSIDEKCALEHLEEDPADHHTPPATPTPNISGNGVTTISDTDISTYVAKLIKDMPAPDRVMNPALIPGRPTKEMIDKGVSEFGLKKGPAEVAAYYDFHSLQIAFDHVWQQLFDEDLIEAGYNLQKKVLQKTGVNVMTTGVFNKDNLNAAFELGGYNPITQIPVSVATHFEITKEEWNDLDQPMQERLEDIADSLDDSLTLTVETRNGANKDTLALSIDAFTREKYYQKKKEQGERIIDSVRHDDYYTLHKTLRDLHQRMNSNYEYTVFAADNNHCSVNFGIMNTFRQEWLPLNYQVGKLCKTVPLSAKEERKYSMKITRHHKVTEKNIKKSNTSFTGEQSSTNRAESEIMAKAQNKTNFNHTGEFSFTVGVYKGAANHSVGIEVINESQQARKDFREAVVKATQEYKDEISMEIDTESSMDSEYTDSGTIINPNDELAVTYLFYELQRRYRISEQLYRVMPVVLVAQTVPKPHEITEAWVIAHDWILNRFLLDESFTPSLQYLANKSVGDDFSLRELRRNLRQQRNLVETLKIEFASASRKADNKYQALLDKVTARISEQGAANDEGFFTNVSAFFGYNDADPDTAKAREIAASDEHRYAVENAEKISVALRQEVDVLHKLTSEYNATLQKHLDNETRTKRLLVHFRNNILYYMQAIWSMEPPDQRFLRMQKVEVPDLVPDEDGYTYKVEVDPSEDILAVLRPEGTQKHKATLKGKLKKPITFKPLAEVADIDKPLGFKGNYVIFPLKKHNALTELMSAPFVDGAFGAMDPDHMGSINLNDFASFICCLHHKEPEKFEAWKGILHKWLTDLLADPLRNGDEIIVPSGALYIEALPATHPILEDFKLKHRELDVFKVQAEVRKLELENLRYAARLVSNEFEDPDIERKIVFNGNGTTPHIDIDN